MMAAMKERPILFNGAMVRAILAGTKTQTRRVVKPQPPSEVTSAGVMSAPGRDHDGEWSWLSGDPKDCDTWGFVGEEFRCPYGYPGDRLWVREAWARTRVLGAEWFVYREGDNRTDYGGPWKPSIHMPRAASRITLEIVSVRVERLRDISDADAEAEGIETVQVSETDFRYVDYLRRTDRTQSEKEATRGSPVMSYATLWESINGPGSWDANPWVWVVEFKRVAA